MTRYWTSQALLTVLVFLQTSLAKADSIPEIVAKAKPAIVEIVTDDATGKPKTLGTGFFVSPDGLVVTNQHVIEGANSISAISNNGSIFLFEHVVAQPSGVDLAVLKFRATEVPFLKLGESMTTVEGQKVIVIGNPTGLTDTVSDGIISAFRENRSMIQITAPISHGSSGSPVMDENGRVIGVATLQNERGQNLNFAIPVQIVSAALATIDQKKPTLPLASSTGGTTSLNLAPEVAQAREFLNSNNAVDAVGVLKDYLARSPTDGEAWVTYAESLGGIQRWEAAADAAQRAVDLDANILTRWRVLTYCLFSMADNANLIASARLKEAAQRDLAMGDDFSIAYYALIQAAETQGEKEKAAQLQQQFDKLMESGELADYVFGKEKRHFGKQVMFPAEQVAKSKGLELTERTLFLDLKGRGHFFTLPIDPLGGAVALVDGIGLGLSSRPVGYKHQRYYLDSDLVEGVIEGVLNPEKSIVSLNTPRLDFTIQNIYLEEYFPLQATERQHAVTQKLIHAALKLEPSLFKYEVESGFDSRGVVINLHCDQSNDFAEGCVITTNLGNEFNSELTGETAAVMVNNAAEWERAKLANAFQILFARAIKANFSKASVTASTAVEALPHPTKNPSLIVHIVLPNSKRNSDDSYELIARSLSQSATLLNSELSK